MSEENPAEGFWNGIGLGMSVLLIAIAIVVLYRGCNNIPILP